MQQIENRLYKVNELNGVIFKPKRIQKRATLDIMENVLGDLFGVLDSRFLKQYAEVMSGSQNNNEHLLKLLQNHTSVVEATVDILKKNDFEMAKHDEQLYILFRKENTKNEFNDLYYYATTATNHLNK